MRADFQGKCLIAKKGSETIGHFDELPLEVRRLFCDASDNICTMCAHGVARENFSLYYEQLSPHIPPLQFWIEAIRQIEQGIRDEHRPRQLD